MKVKVSKKQGQSVAISTQFIKLEAAMKLANIMSSGGSAKAVIQEGLVLVNGEVCTMRGKKLYPGDQFSFEGGSYLITAYEA